MPFTDDSAFNLLFLSVSPNLCHFYQTTNCTTKDDVKSHYWYDECIVIINENIMRCSTPTFVPVQCAILLMGKGSEFCTTHLIDSAVSVHHGMIDWELNGRFLSSI